MFELRCGRENQLRINLTRTTLTDWSMRLTGLFSGQAEITQKWVFIKLDFRPMLNSQFTLDHVANVKAVEVDS